jgi:hypothetical protein
MGNRAPQGVFKTKYKYNILRSVPRAGHSSARVEQHHLFTLTHNVAYHGPWTLSESRKRCFLYYTTELPSSTIPY